MKEENRNEKAHWDKNYLDEDYYKPEEAKRKREMMVGPDPRRTVFIYSGDSDIDLNWFTEEIFARKNPCNAITDGLCRWMRDAKPGDVKQLDKIWIICINKPTEWENHV